MERDPRGNKRCSSVHNEFNQKYYIISIFKKETVHLYTVRLLKFLKASRYISNRRCRNNLNQAYREVRVGYFLHGFSQTQFPGQSEALHYVLDT